MDAHRIVASRIDVGRVDARRIAQIGAGGFALIAGAFWIWWPLGIVLALVSGITVVAIVGRHMQRVAEAESSDEALDFTGEAELRDDVLRLRDRLGDDWWQFADAAVLVTRSQWASAAALQRDMGVSTARARHLLGLLEREGFVGPSRGSRRREVLVGAASALDLQRLLRA